MQEQPKLHERAGKITRWIGSPQSIIIHTILFTACFAAGFLGVIAFEDMLLLLTTIVSLEAIYLSLFIQMTVNQAAASVEAVSEDIEEIQEDVEEMQKDVDEIQKDVDELQEDVEEINEDVEELNEEEVEENRRQAAHEETLSTIQADLRRLLADIDKLKEGR
mgnify:FL=1